jgi:hypothetical protein
MPQERAHELSAPLSEPGPSRSDDPPLWVSDEVAHTYGTGVRTHLVHTRTGANSTRGKRVQSTNRRCRWSHGFPGEGVSAMTVSETSPVAELERLTVHHVSRERSKTFSPG